MGGGKEIDKQRGNKWTRVVNLYRGGEKVREEIESKEESEWEK